MPFKNPPDSLTLPSDATTGPRIVLGTEIPPEIVSYDVQRTWGAVVLWYFNDTEYYFIGTGHKENPGPTPDWDFVVKGTYTISDGITIHEELITAATKSVTYGDAVNFLSFHYYNAEIVVESNSAVRLPQATESNGYITRNQVGWGIIGSGLLGGAGVLSAGAEVAIPVANWTAAGGIEPNCNFMRGRIYRIWLRGEAFNAGGGLSISRVKIRKGSATIVGQQLHECFIERDTNFASVSFETHCYVKNATASDIVTKLSVTNLKFAGAPNLTIGGPMWMEIEDVGAIGDNVEYEDFAASVV